MGREIIFEVRDTGKPVFPEGNEPLSVCGRDNATTYMAQLILDSDTNDEEILYLTCNEYAFYEEIKDRLREYLKEDQHEIQKAKDALEDLREARRHTATLKDFEDFSNAMDGTEDWIKENNWSRAGDMIEYLDKCYSKMLDLVTEDKNEDRPYVINRYKVAIIWSE